MNQSSYANLMDILFKDLKKINFFIVHIYIYVIFSDSLRQTFWYLIKEF